jgi:hypothetical protein
MAWGSRQALEPFEVGLSLLQEGVSALFGFIAHIEE